MSKLQEEPCKHCGYREYDPPANGNTLASWHIVEMISREPIRYLRCERCDKKMQLYYQSSHRRFYKCWNCGNMDADRKFYESVQHDEYSS